MLAENGVYTLVGKTTYTYTVGKPGYVSKSGTIVLSQDKAETVSLEKAEETTFEPVDSSWTVRRSDNLNVVDAKAPESKNAAEIKWDVVSGTNAQSLDTRSDAILLGNQLCLFHGDKLQLVNKETGEVEKEVTMSDSANGQENQAALCRRHDLCGTADRKRSHWQRPGISLDLSGQDVCDAGSCHAV
ncbi:MAG: hypothetical protein V8S96_04125 [Lachnospiraceae bacterium]